MRIRVRRVPGTTFRPDLPPSRGDEGNVVEQPGAAEAVGEPPTWQEMHLPSRGDEARRLGRQGALAEQGARVRWRPGGTARQAAWGGPWMIGWVALPL